MKAIEFMRQKVLGALAEISDPRARPFLPLIGQPPTRAVFDGLMKEDPQNLAYLRMLGALAARRGEREEASRISRQLEEMKRPYLWGRPTYHRACIASLLGEKETAVRLLQQAISQGQVYGILDDMDLDPLRDYPPFKELIKPKG